MISLTPTNTNATRYLIVSCVYLSPTYFFQSLLMKPCKADNGKYNFLGT